MNKARLIVEATKALAEMAPDDQELQEVIGAYEWLKKKCEKSPGFKRGLEMYMLERGAEVAERLNLPNLYDGTLEEFVQHIKKEKGE